MARSTGAILPSHSFGPSVAGAAPAGRPAPTADSEDASISADIEAAVGRFAPNLGPGSRAIDIEQAFRLGLVRAPRGFRVPQAATFARLLGVSQLRCADALAKLAAEGRLVAEEEFYRVVATGAADPGIGRYRSIEEHLSAGRAYAPLGAGEIGEMRPLAPGQSALDLFPAAGWARFEARVVRMLGTGILGLAEPQGFRPLREAIAGWLAENGWKEADADSLVLFGSRQQALVAVLGAFAEIGNQIWLEDPADRAQLRALDALRLRAVPIGLGREGLEQELAEEMAPGARGAVVSASTHFFDGAATGDTLEALDRWAAAHDGWIVADERGGGFALADRRAALRGTRTIAVGSFAQVAFPGLAVAWALCPEGIRDRVLERRIEMDEPGSLLVQATFADMMASGAFAQHLARLKQAVEERASAFRDGLGAALAPRLHLNRPGLVATIETGHGTTDTELARAANAQGLGVVALSTLLAGAQLQQGIVCGFAGTGATQTYRAAVRLAALLERHGRGK